MTKNRLKELIQLHKPEIFAASVTAGMCLLTIFYAIGLKQGKLVASHGPCIEVGRKGADALLAGKTMMVKLDGGDVLYKIMTD